MNMRSKNNTSKPKIVLSHKVLVEKLPTLGLYTQKVISKYLVCLFAFTPNSIIFGSHMFYHEKKFFHSFKLRFLFIKIQVTFSGKAKLLYNLECLSEKFLRKRYFQLPIQD